MIDINIPTAKQFLDDQIKQKNIWKNEAIKHINKQIENVFKYITNSSNGETHQKVYKEIRISLDVDKKSLGMSDVVAYLNEVGYSVSLYDVDAFNKLLGDQSNENRVYDYDIFDTSVKGNGGESFDTRTYKPIRGIGLIHRQVKSWIVLHVK